MLLLHHSYSCSFSNTIYCCLQCTVLHDPSAHLHFCSTGGRQFKITVNDTIIINRIDADTGDRIRLEKVCLGLLYLLHYAKKWHKKCMAFLSHWLPIGHVQHPNVGAFLTLLIHRENGRENLVVVKVYSSWPLDYCYLTGSNDWWWKFHSGRNTISSVSILYIAKIQWHSEVQQIYC